MTKLPISATVSNASMLDLIETSLRLQFIEPNMLSELDLDPTEIKVLAGRSPESSLIKLWKLIDATNPNSGAGLAIGTVVNSAAKGVLASWVSQSDTVREALDIFIDNISLMGPSEVWHLSIKGSEATLRLDLDPSKGYPTIAIERSMSALVTWGRALTGMEYPIRQAAFTFSKPAYLDRFHAIFGPELRFGTTENSITIDRCFLSRKVISSNVFLKELLEGQARQVIKQFESFVTLNERVRDLVEQRLANRRAISADQIAQALSMSRQSLHRKLKEEHSSFKTIFDSARAKLASQLLQNANLSISTVSLELGFKDTSSFYKAFHRWFNMSPNNFRQNKLNARG